MRLKHVSDPIELGDDGAALRKEIRRQEREQEPPIVKWDAENVMPEPGPSESFAKQIRRATEALPKARMAALEKEFAALPREEQARQLAEFTIRGGEKKVLPVTDDGRLVAPLHDGQPIGELDSFRNHQEMKRGFSQFRDLQDKAIEAETQRLLAEDDAEQARVEAAARTVQQPQPAPQPALEQERAQLQAERVQLAANEYWRQLSREEQAAANEMVQIQQWAVQSYTPGELQGQPVQGDERRAWLAEAGRRYNALQQGLQTASTVRAAQHTQETEARKQHIRQWGEQQDALFTSQLAERHPQLAANPEKMRRAARDYLIKTTGLTEREITKRWQAGQWRSAPEQMILADAVSAHMARENARNLNARRAPVPPVQRPGVYQPRGAGDLEQISNLKQQLSEARGDRASLEIARKLTQAKRAAGQLYNGD